MENGVRYGCSGLEATCMEFVASDSSTVDVSEFYWVGETTKKKGSIQKNRAFWDEWEERPDLLPFGGDGHGDMVLIKIKGSSKGSIYHWNHKGELVKKTASSFAAFANGLEKLYTGAGTFLVSVGAICI